MSRRYKFRGLLVATGAFLAFGIGPAVAQSGGSSSRRRPPQQPSRVIELPPEPLGPNSLGLLEREFQYMRRTAPQPDKFLYGRWNPRYQVINPLPNTGGSGQFYYYNNYPTYPYGGGVYGGYNPYGGLGYGGGVYGYPQYNGPQVVTQQEVVILQQRAQQQQQQQQQPQAPVAQPRRTEPKPDLGDFYLGGSKQNETITDALDDIRKAWLNGDFARLNARFKTDGQVKIFPKGQFKFAVDSKDFTAMLKDAMTKVDTMSFEFDRPKSEATGPVLATGVHTFADADKQKQTTYVSYGLERIGGKWLIVEAGSSSTPILKHTE